MIDFDMTYCLSATCPFIDDCFRSAKRLEGITGFFSFADFSGVCRRYIAHAVDQVSDEHRGLNNG